MKELGYTTKVFFLLFFSLFLFPFVSNSFAKEKEGFELRNISPLTFGSFVANSGGRITIMTTSIRRGSGSLILLSSGTYSSSKFLASGSSSQSYFLMLPRDGTVVLRRYGGGGNMILEGFDSLPSGFTRLNPGGQQMISVGATLIVNSHQEPGEYSGEFDVIAVLE